MHTFSKLGRGVFVATYRGCAPGSYLCISLVSLAEQFLSLFVVGALPIVHTFSKLGRPFLLLFIVGALLGANRAYF